MTKGALPPSHQRITARDADRLLKGEWHDLIRLRRKEIDDPIKNMIPVHIGNATEALNVQLAADACENTKPPLGTIVGYNRIQLGDNARLRRSPRSGRLYAWHEPTRFICKPDGLLIGQVKLPFEAKHSSRNGDFVSTADRIKGWMPQLQTTLLIFDAPYLLLSCLWNTDSHTMYWIPRDDIWQAELIDRAGLIAPFLEDPLLEAPMDFGPADLPCVEPLRFNNRAVKDWLASQQVPA